MCKPFSGVITKSCKGYYDNKIQSHSEVVDLFKAQDPELIDDKLPPENTFAKFEITPDNGNLLLPDKWSFHLDEDVKPKWWKKRHEETAWGLHEAWLKWLYTKIDVSKYPKNPLLMRPQPFEKLDSVRGSVGGLVWDSVRGLVGGSVGDSVWGSVRDSVGGLVWDSVRDSVWGSVRLNIAFMFPEIWEKFKKHQPIVDLWHKGIVPVWYLDSWHYYGSPNGDGTAVEIILEKKEGE